MHANPESLRREGRSRGRSHPGHPARAVRRLRPRAGHPGRRAGDRPQVPRRGHHRPVRARTAERADQDQHRPAAHHPRGQGAPSRLQGGTTLSGAASLPGAVPRAHQGPLARRPQGHRGQDPRAARQLRLRGVGPTELASQDRRAALRAMDGPPAPRRPHRAERGAPRARGQGRSPAAGPAERVPCRGLRRQRHRQDRRRRPPAPLHGPVPGAAGAGARPRGGQRRRGTGPPDPVALRGARREVHPAAGHPPHHQRRRHRHHGQRVRGDQRGGAEADRRRRNHRGLRHRPRHRQPRLDPSRLRRARPGHQELPDHRRLELDHQQPRRQRRPPPIWTRGTAPT